jgi:hypothetical protein
MITVTHVPFVLVQVRGHRGNFFSNHLSLMIWDAQGTHVPEDKVSKSKTPAEPKLSLSQSASRTFFNQLMYLSMLLSKIVCVQPGMTGFETVMPNTRKQETETTTLSRNCQYGLNSSQRHPAATRSKSFHCCGIAAQGWFSAPFHHETEGKESFLGMERAGVWVVVVEILSNSSRR